MQMKLARMHSPVEPFRELAKTWSLGAQSRRERYQPNSSACVEISSAGGPAS